MAADNVESLDEKDLNDVSGAAAGWTLSKWYTDPQKAEYVYHRGVLVKKDAPTDGSKEWRTICTYECRDCGRIMNVALSTRTRIMFRQNFWKHPTVVIFTGAPGNKLDSVIYMAW